MEEEGQGIKRRDLLGGFFGLLGLSALSPLEAFAKKALKAGGFLVSYSPTIPQTADFVNKINSDKNFVHVKTSEVIERNWEIDERKVRPKSQQIGHSGFVSFVRKVLSIKQKKKIK